MFPRSIQRRLLNLLIFVGPATTLAISPWTNFDPINLIKALILTTTSFAIIGLLLPYFSTFFSRVGKTVFLIASGFIIAMFSTLLFSGAPFSQQIWGTFGRNTGLLTYLSLIFVLLATATIYSISGYEKILWGLIATVSFMTIYCLFQIAKLDPIRWSAFYPFGTLGNVNFLSGFMGLGLVTVFVLASEKKFSTSGRIALGALFFFGAFVLFKSDSTQGVVGLFVGISTYLLIKSWYWHKFLFAIASIAFVTGIVSLFLGLLNQGPLKSVIYQFTVLYRADYMHAGISMLLSNPLTGVGMDSYDDWYRLERGLISAVRTGLGRTANSAHNITLDVASGGGFPLLLCYLALLVAILFAFFRGLRRGFAKNPIFLAASMSWIAYQVQAAVSINQIGVGVWGWILGGILLGIAKSDNTAEVKSSAKDKVNKESQKTLKKGSPNTPPPLPVISSFAILSLGFFLSFLPFKADADFARATKSGSAELITEISERPAVNAFILSKSAADSLQSNVLELSKEIISKLVTSYPRNISGWMLMMQHPNFTLADRDKALEAIGKIDPYLRFCYSPNAVDQFREALNELPAEEKYKLARGWGLAPSLSPESIAKFTFSQVGEGSYEERLQSICGY